MPLRCPYCNSSAVIDDQLRGERICTRCGLVLVEKRLSPAPDWHMEPSERVGRADVGAGLDIAQHDWGLRTKLGMSSDLSPSWRARLRRLRMWHHRSRATTYEQKSLRRVLIDLDKLCEDLGLPKGIQIEVSSLYRKAKVRKLTGGRNTWSVLAGLALVVSRRRGVPKSRKEVARALAVRAGLKKEEAEREVRQLARAISKELELHVPLPRPEDYLARFGSELNLPRRTVTRAREICRSLPDRFKRRKAAFVLAATLTYLAARETRERMTVRQVSEVLEVGTSSLSKTLGQLWHSDYSKDLVEFNITDRGIRVYPNRRRDLKGHLRRGGK